MIAGSTTVTNIDTLLNATTGGRASARDNLSPNLNPTHLPVHCIGMMQDTPGRSHKTRNKPLQHALALVTAGMRQGQQ